MEKESETKVLSVNEKLDMFRNKLDDIVNTINKLDE